VRGRSLLERQVTWATQVTTGRRGSRGGRSTGRLSKRQGGCWQTSGGNRKCLQDKDGRSSEFQSAGGGALSGVEMLGACERSLSRRGLVGFDAAVRRVCDSSRDSSTCTKIQGGDYGCSQWATSECEQDMRRAASVVGGLKNDDAARALE